MNEPKKKPTKQSLKEENRRHKLATKAERQSERLARKQERQSRKRARRQQRVVVAYRAHVAREEAVALLEEILAGLKAGKVNIESGDEKLKLEPPDQVVVAVRARQKFKTEGVTLRVKWPRKPSDKSPTIKVTKK